jgi:hypothetical protein
MQFWEENCMLAASGVTNELAQLVEIETDNSKTWRDSWNSRFTAILNSLAEEEIGKENLKIETYNQALVDVLNPLHNDVAESTPITFPNLTDKFINLPKDDISSISGKINTKLHISIQESTQFAPGNFYKLSDCAKSISFESKKLFEDLVQAEHKADDNLFNRTTPVLIELSASCDYAQNKIKFAKLLGGLLVEKKDFSLFKQPNYQQPIEAILSLGPLWLLEKEQQVLLSSHYLLTVDKNQVENQNSFARLRNQWLTYVQFWLAQQLSRPGVVLLK